MPRPSAALTAPVCFCILASSAVLPPVGDDADLLESTIAAGSHSTTDPSARPPARRPNCANNPSGRDSNGAIASEQVSLVATCPHRIPCKVSPGAWAPMPGG